MPKDEHIIAQNVCDKQLLLRSDSDIIVFMRIDKFLKISRLIKRRTVAAQACDGGKVKVNDRAVKPSYTVKPNDLICISLGAHAVTVRVKAISETVSKDGAAELYEIVQ